MSEAFEDDIDRDLRKNIYQCKFLVEQIKIKSALGKSVTTELTQLKTVAENIRISHMLLEERFKLREEKVKTLGTTALDWHQVMAEGYRKALTEYLNIVDSLPSASSSQEPVDSRQQLTTPQPAARNTQQLLDLLNKLLPKKKRSFYGNLPHKHLNSEIATLAQSLNWQPGAIYAPSAGASRTPAMVMSGVRLCGRYRRLMAIGKISKHGGDCSYARACRLHMGHCLCIG